jgi:hypothetical protein
MGRRKVKRRTRQGADELVREVVAAVVPARERARYMPFARELCATLKRPPGPDYTRQTKAVIVRWFRRGLHGNLLWRIGSGLLGRLYPDAATGIVDD